MSGRRKRRSVSQSHSGENNCQTEHKQPKLESAPSISQEKVKTTYVDESGVNDPFLSIHEDVVGAFVDLDMQINFEPDKVSPLSKVELNDLEKALEFRISPNKEEWDEWRPDWSGNIAYADKPVSNPKATAREKKSSFKQPLLSWAHTIPAVAPYVHNLIRHVYHMEGTPKAAKMILSSVDHSSSTEAVEFVMRRVLYDPAVLKQDGWVTKRVLTPVGATGGAYHIGGKIRWQESDAVIIAYVHDPDIGDLWKAYWIDEKQGFDLEYEEVLDARKKWDRRYGGPAKAELSRKSARYAGSSDFSVPGIEYGIVLATSFSRGARPGVYWPARIVHASERMGSTQQGKRSAAKQKVDVVFLAPYWSSDDQVGRSRRVEGRSEVTVAAFSAGPLFLLENVDATSEMLKEYTFGSDGIVDIDELRMAFRFTGLPKHAFSRYVDSHRLAMALRLYAKEKLDTEMVPSELASASLFDTHMMSVQAPVFPSVVLELPYHYILEKIHEENGREDGIGPKESSEQPLQLDSIVKAMEPPLCRGESSKVSHSSSSGLGAPPSSPFPEHRTENGSKEFISSHGSSPALEGALFNELMNGLKLLQSVFLESSPGTVAMRSMIGGLLQKLSTENTPSFSPQKRKSCLKSWVALKQFGRDNLRVGGDTTKITKEWGLFCERLFRKLVSRFSSEQEGSGVSLVLTDYRCNGHRTSNGCFERAVRLPAALKAAKLGGAGKSLKQALVTEIDQRYVDFVVDSVLPMAHARSYIERMKSRCALAKPGDEGIVLTDDSRGNGGTDTRGSVGTWDAAVAAVATAIAGVDKVVYGEAVSAFCVTRPPGHHAGRQIHSMKAVSNGFCILNAAACAALYAATSVAEGGIGLKRVCVIDFDVHHGNGTQDILCSTFDPRFLFVSTHAGGADVNGRTMEDDPNHELHDLAGSSKSGIFPGRCGDTSPHEGVLNIPLGPKVLPHDIGLALISRVTPRVNAFNPDLIIVSAGFDAHKADPVGLGSLSAVDFGHITEAICAMAAKSCSGRVLSIMEGGYGVPCVRPQRPIPVPIAEMDSTSQLSTTTGDQKTLGEFTSSTTLKAEGSNGESQSKEQDKEQDKEKNDSSTLTAVSSVQPTQEANGPASSSSLNKPQGQVPAILLDLGDDLPDDMDDQLPEALLKRLEKCHAEGFIECVSEHVRTLARAATSLPS